MYFVFLSFLRATIFNFVIFVTRYTRGVVSFFGKLKNISKHLVLPHLIINFVAGKLETVKGYKLCCNYSTESNCDAHVTISSTMVAIKNIYGDGSFASCIYILAIKIPFALNKCSLNLLFIRSYISSACMLSREKRIHQRCAQWVRLLLKNEIRQFSPVHVIRNIS